MKNYKIMGVQGGNSLQHLFGVFVMHYSIANHNTLFCSVELTKFDEMH